ncbi:MAG: hypothetical protein K8T25_09290 [Planctomycetia bacterium]|nr:hypothetical protein [Planctomycetia bacterium]
MTLANVLQLREALTRRRWQITERLRGDDNVEGSATWEIQRNGAGPIFLIDFDGLGGMGEDISHDSNDCIGCEVRDFKIRLYFSRVNRSLERWLADLKLFTSSLDKVANAKPDDSPAGDL